MTKKTHSKRLLNKTNLVAALIAGGMAVGGVTYSQNVEPQDKTINKEQTELSIEQLEKLIQDCDTALANLQKTINSGKTNPEEIFYARTAFIKITEQRKDLIKRLEEAQKHEKTTIKFFDAGNER